MKKIEYSLLLLKMDIQKVAGTLMATGKTGFFGCTLLGGDGSKMTYDQSISWKIYKSGDSALDAKSFLIRFVWIPT